MDQQKICKHFWGIPVLGSFQMLWFQAPQPCLDLNQSYLQPFCWWMSFWLPVSNKTLILSPFTLAMAVWSATFTPELDDVFPTQDVAWTFRVDALVGLGCASLSLVMGGVRGVESLEPTLEQMAVWCFPLQCLHLALFLHWKDLCPPRKQMKHFPDLNRTFLRSFGSFTTGQSSGLWVLSQKIHFPS